MVKVFQEPLPVEMVIKVLRCFNLKNFDDNKIFSINDLILFDTTKKLRGLTMELCKYFLPCKAKNFLHNINLKKCLMLLKLILRDNGYKLVSKNGGKIINSEVKLDMIYRIVSTTGKPPKLINKTSVIITFD
tara:strand:- start:192 stop:587 length:396 start_codon:yes stop_codon:yes gene_type:complete